jgi:hypothetical protein
VTVSITDHALLRWLERHHGIDFRPYRDELAALVQPFADIKARYAPVAPGLYAVLGEGAVTTVLPGKPPRRLPEIDAPPNEKLNWKAQARKRRHK